MLFEDRYKTIENFSEASFTEKGSKFIAYAHPFTDESTLKSILTALKNTYPKASHYCYAYRLGLDRSVFRINDDGEPAGSAGRPILNVLLSKDLTNILVVVIRYFGGTLLGVPGLIKAYKHATELAIISANLIEKQLLNIYEVKFEYILMNEVMRIIKEYNLSILFQKPEMNCTMQIAIPKAKVNVVLQRFKLIENMEINFRKQQ